jgi:oligopeptide/dipeptide ABC transporter ATP-binding protein
MSLGETVTSNNEALGSPLLQVKGLETHFFTDEGTVRAVDGAEFNVYAGRTLGIVGESGCGKSVTAKSILQIVDRPGRVVDGQIIYSPDAEPEKDLLKLGANSREMRTVRGGEISMIFQEPISSFSPVHTFGNQIVEAIKLHTDLNAADAYGLALEWLQRVGIPNPEQRLSEYPYQFSGGQRQRAMIAMALSTNPRILIADEPTTALDVTTQAQILDLLLQLRDENEMAIIFITHDLGVIAEIADDVAVMYLGQVVETGPVEEIFESPKHPYTIALLNSIPSMVAAPRDRLPSITGAIPHPQNRPSGCPFHPRCPSFIPDVCNQREPSNTTIDSNRKVRCFLHEAI